MDPPISLTWRHLLLRDPALPRNPNDFVPGHPRHEMNGFLPPPTFISFPGQTRCLEGAMWGSLLVKAPSPPLSSGSLLGWVTHLHSPVSACPRQALFVHLSLCLPGLLWLLGICPLPPPSVPTQLLAISTPLQTHPLVIVIKTITNLCQIPIMSQY